MSQYPYQKKLFMCLLDRRETLSFSGMLRLSKADLIGAALVIPFLAVTLPPYFYLLFSSIMYNDDQRQVVWTIYALLDSSLFPQDFIFPYIQDILLPDGFLILIKTATHVISPENAFLIINLLSIAICGLFAFLTGRSISGPIGGWACLALVFAADFVLARTAGGLPRGIGLALLFVAAFGFITQRAAFTATATILGALLYYPAAAVSGLLLAAQLLIPAGWIASNHRHTWRRRCCAVAGVGVVALTPFLFGAVGTERYGSMITAADPAWPEAGPGGRFSTQDLLGPTAPNPRAFLVAALNTHVSRSDPAAAWRPPGAVFDRIASMVGLIVYAATMAVVFICCRRSLVARRLLFLPILGGALYGIAFLASPYLYVPTRYLVLLIIFGLLAFPYAIAALATRFGRVPKVRAETGVVMVATLMLILACGGRPHAQGLTVSLTPDMQDALRAAAQTPPGSRFAGWPNGLIDNVPHVAKRPILLSYEVHLPWHKTYAEEMRARAQTLINAWFSPDATGVRVLRDRYDVDYVLIDKKLLATDAERYFKPYDRLINRARKRLGDKPAFLSDPKGLEVIFDNRAYRIVALAPSQPRQ